MKVTADGVIYELQVHGGISRIFTEIFPRMCQMDPSMRIDIWTCHPLKQAIPGHRHIFHRTYPRMDRYLRPNRLFLPVLKPANQWAKQLWMGSGQGRIWHSTYYTTPIRWKGRQVVTVSDMIYERFPDLFHRPADAHFRELKRRSLHVADAIICNSQTTRQDLLQMFPVGNKPIFVTYLAHGPEFYRKSEPDSWDMAPIQIPFILYTGMRTHHKNFIRFLNAYANWHANRDVGLVVVGSPWSEAEKQSLANARIDHRIHLLTGIDDKTLCRLYNSAEFFVYPSLYEGFGIPLLEAMACGCPVVASRIPSTVEIAGDCPIYFDPLSQESLIHAMNRALDLGRTPETVRKWTRHASKFSWDKTAKQTLAVYRHLMGHTE